MKFELEEKEKDIHYYSTKMQLAEVELAKWTDDKVRNIQFTEEVAKYREENYILHEKNNRLLVDNESLTRRLATAERSRKVEVEENKEVVFVDRIPNFETQLDPFDQINMERVCY